MPDQIGIDGLAVTACVRQIADSRTRPRQDIDDVFSQLESDGLIGAIAALVPGSGLVVPRRPTSTLMTIRFNPLKIRESDALSPLCARACAVSTHTVSAWTAVYC
jgi:hypothetical protein